MLGIIVPTKDRSDFVIRLLRYYERVQLPYTIYIGDSSTGEHLDKLLAEIDRLKGVVNVVHGHYPSLGPELTMQALVNSVSEKYCAYCGDDDFLVMKGITQAIDFLEKNSDYSTAHGEALMFSVKDDLVYGEIASCGPYRLKEQEENSGQERLKQFLSNYWVPQFSIHRTEEFVKAFEPFTDLTDRAFTEILCNSFSIVQGKSKKFDSLYLVRTVHNQRNLMLGNFSWIVSKEWNPSYQVFHDSLVKLLCEQDKVDRETASQCVQEAFNDYLTRAFKKSSRTDEVSRRSRIKERLNQDSGLYKLLYKMKNLYTRQTVKESLPALLSPGSLYYADFKPLVDVVTMGETVVER